MQQIVGGQNAVVNRFRANVTMLRVVMYNNAEQIDGNSSFLKCFVFCLAYRLSC